MAKKITHYEPGYLYNRLKEAIANDDKEKAYELIDTLYGGTKNMHDSLMDNLSILFTFVVDKLGENAVDEAWQIMGDAKFGKSIDKMKTGELTYEQFRDYIRIGEMCHFSEFSEVEDDEKVDFIMHKCGFCQNLMCNNKLDRQPGEAPFKIGSVKEPHAWNLGYTGMPYYCCHGPRLFSILGKQKGYDCLDYLWGRQFDDYGNPVDEPCHEIIYRVPRNKTFDVTKE